MAVDERKKDVFVRKKSAKGAKHGVDFAGPQPARAIVHLPPITVDQLASFRKKKAGLLVPTDNLCLPDGSFSHLKTEYERRFKCYDKYFPQLAIYAERKIPRDPLVLGLDDSPEFHTEYEEAYKRVIERLCMPDSLKSIQDNGDVDLRSKRTKLVRKCTNLKLEGDLSHITSYAEDFIRYLLVERQQLQRRSTTLRLLGKMDYRTENRNSFVPYGNFTRPPLCKKFTNLHLSGSFHMDTENKDKFLPFKIERQHQLTKLPTNLHLEGTLLLEPEYKSAFVQYQHYEKPKPMIPHDRIKSPVEFSDENGLSHWLNHPLIPYLRTYEPTEEYCGSRWGSRAPSRSSSRPPSRITSRPPSRATSRPPSRSLSRPPSRVSSRSPSRRDTKKVATFRKSESDMETDREKMPRKPTTLQVPSLNSRSKTDVDERNQRSSNRSSPDRVVRYFTKTLTPNMASRIPNPLLVTEENVFDSNKNVKMKNWHPVAFRDDMRLNRRTNEPEYFKTGFECQPEYRKAYMNYLVRERLEHKPHLIKRSPSGQRDFSVSDDTSDTSVNNHYNSDAKPPICRKIQKNLEKMETSAFGPKCRKVSNAETTSSDDTFAAAIKKSLIPRPVTLPLRTRTRMDTNTSDESVSEPAFLVM